MANIIEVIVKGEDKASAVIGGIGSSLSGLGSVAAGVATGGLALAAAAVVGLGAAAVGATIGITKLALAAADVEGTRQTFERLGGDIDSLKEATRGMVGEADLMAASNKFLTMGITENAEATATMAEMATQLGLAMGTDATKSMEDFALMMANQSIPRLDTFGISSAAVRDRIAELQAATEGLSREEAFKIAVMEQGALAMEKVGEQGESATATTLRWKTAIADLKLGIGQAFIPALEAIRKPVLELVDEYGPRVVEWADIAGEWLGEKLPIAIEKVKEAWVAIKPSLIWTRDMFQKFVTAYLPHLRKAWDRLKEGFDEVVELYNILLKPALEDLWAALGLGETKSEDIASGFGEFMGVLTRLMASGVIEAIKFGIWAITQAVDAAKIGIDLFKMGIIIAEYAMDRIKGAIIRVRDAFGSVLGVFNEVRHWIAVLVEKFDHFKSTLGNFQLPWWLQPGSPTPLELGLLGIGKALAEVQGLSTGGLFIGAGGGGGDTRTVSNNLTMNVQTRATAGQVVMGFETMRALV